MLSGVELHDNIEMFLSGTGEEENRLYLNVTDDEDFEAEALKPRAKPETSNNPLPNWVPPAQL